MIVIYWKVGCHINHLNNDKPYLNIHYPNTNQIALIRHCFIKKIGLLWNKWNIPRGLYCCRSRTVSVPKGALAKGAVPYMYVFQPPFPPTLASVDKLFIPLVAQVWQSHQNKASTQVSALAPLSYHTCQIHSLFYSPSCNRWEYKTSKCGSLVNSLNSNPSLEDLDFIHFPLSQP